MPKSPSMVQWRVIARRSWGFTSEPSPSTRRRQDTPRVLLCVGFDLDAEGLQPLGVACV